MKRITAAVLVLVMVLTLAPIVSAAQTLGKPVTGDISYHYEISHYFEKESEVGEKCIGTQTVYFDDDWFKGSAYEYNHKLMLLSLCASMSSITYDNTGTGYIPDGDRLAREFLTAIGCEEDAIRTHRYDENLSIEDVTGIAFGVKSIPGTDQYLVAVLPRGNGYGGEWVSDVRIYSEDYEKHTAGFRKAAEYAYDRLMEYIDFLNEEYGIEKTDLKIWALGFSRSASVVNNLGQLLDDNSGIDPEGIFIYDLAVPATVQKGSEGDYPNIFNVCSELDMVARVPLIEWNYTLYGTTFFLPCLSETPEEYIRLLPTVKKNFSEIMTAAGLPEIEYRPLPYQEKAIDLLASYLMDAIETPEAYLYEGWQKILEDVTYALHGHDENADSVVEVLLYAVLPDMKLLPDVLEFFGGLLTRSPVQNYTEAAKLIGKLNIRKTLMAAGRDRELVIMLINLLSNFRKSLLASIITGGRADNVKYYSVLLASVAGIVLKSADSALLMQHWPESYLAWMRSGEENDLFADEMHDIVPIKTPQVGDTNADGRIDARDLRVLNRYLLAPNSVSIDKTAADIDGNGRITVIDSIRLTKMLAIR